MAFFFNRYPYTDFHELNLDWIISKIKDIKDAVTSADESAQAAYKSAEDAANMADAASSSAESAAESAESAAESAKNAAESAADAKDYADNIADPVSGIVTNWLNSNITEDPNVLVDASLTVRGAAADAHVTGNHVQEIGNNILIETEKSLYTSASGWRIKTNGSCTSNQLYIMDKYRVTAGTHIKIIASDTPLEDDSVYQFQSASSVPSATPNQYLVGETVKGNINDYVTVPAGATWLIISRLQTNTYNKVYLVESVIDSVNDKTDNAIERLKNIDGLIYYPYWELGTISSNAENNTFDFYGSDVRIRTPQNKFIELNRGDVIGFYDKTGVQFEVFWYDDNNDIHSIAFRNSEYTIKEHGQYGIVVRYNPEVNITNIETLSDKIYIKETNVIDNLIDSVYNLPSNWTDIIETVKADQGKKFIFGLQTDTHYNKNVISNVSVNYLKWLSQKINFNFIGNLGDIISGYTGTTYQDTNELMRESMTDIISGYVTNSNCPVLLTWGNHDTNYSHAVENEDPDFSYEELYARITAATSDTTNINQNGISSYYFKDFDNYNIRVIVLNTCEGTTNQQGYHDTFGMNADQLAWLNNTALNTDKAVLILTHVPLVSGMSVNHIAAYTTALGYIENFASNGGTVIACIYGHTHDEQDVVQNGINHITLQQSLFVCSIVSIDPINRVIKITGPNDSNYPVTNRTINY